MLSTLLTSVIKYSRQWIWDWNIQTWKVKVDKNFLNMLWLDTKDTKFSYKMWEEIIHIDDRRIVMEEVEKCRSWKQDFFQFTYRLRHTNWEYLWITAAGKITKFDKNNNPLRAIWTHMDISEITNIKNYMVANEQKLHAIIDSIPDLLLVLDKDGNYKEIYSWNPNYFIWWRKEWWNVSTIFDKQNTKLVMETIKKTIETKKTQHLEYELKWKDEIHYFSWSFQALDDNNIVIITRDVTQQKKLELEKEEYKKKLEHMAMHDSLTWIANRAYFNEELNRLINISQRINKKLAIMFIDLDWFKQVNDVYWHIIWDELLKVISEKFKKVIRESDFVARLWWDEFGIIMTNIEKKEDYEILAKRIIEELKKPIFIQLKEINIWCSIGISIFPDHSKNCNDLLRYADIAMYNVKYASKNNFKTYQK